jgi:hypothetical protein
MFAGEPIAKDTPIWRWEDRFHELVVDKASLLSVLSRLPADSRRAYLMHCYVDSGLIWHELDDERFINHSSTQDDMSCAAPFDPTGRTGFALRDIAPGEEILENYSGDGVAEFPDWFLATLQKYRVDYDVAGWAEENG